MSDETPVIPGALERRVRRLEDAHAAMEKSIGALGTQMALSEQEQRHMRELMDARFGSLETAVSGVAAKVDTLTTLLQAQSTDPNSTVINREVAADIKDLKDKVNSHESLLQQGLGASKVFKVLVTILGVAGTVLGAFSALHILGVIR